MSENNEKIKEAELSELIERFKSAAVDLFTKLARDSLNYVHRETGSLAERINSTLQKAEPENKPQTAVPSHPEAEKAGKLLPEDCALDVEELAQLLKEKTVLVKAVSPGEVECFRITTTNIYVPNDPKPGQRQIRPKFQIKYDKVKDQPGTLYTIWVHAWNLGVIANNGIVAIDGITPLGNDQKEIKKMGEIAVNLGIDEKHGDKKLDGQPVNNEHLWIEWIEEDKD